MTNNGQTYATIWNCITFLSRSERFCIYLWQETCLVRAVRKGLSLVDEKKRERELLSEYDNEVGFVEEKGICSLVLLSGNHWTSEPSLTVTFCNY